MIQRIGFLFLILCATACEQGPNSVQISSASAFARRYSQSKLSTLNVRASAAGPDCSILLVETGVPLVNTTVEALQYGAGDYDLWDGGVQQFCRERAFSGVVYRDPDGKIWAYGAITPVEGASIKRCRERAWLASF